jgi:hypothetical protein
VLNLFVVDIPIVSSTSTVQNRNEPLSEAGPNFPKTGSTRFCLVFFGGGGLKRITTAISPLKGKTSICVFPLGIQLRPVIFFAIPSIHSRNVEKLFMENMEER